MMRPYTLFLMRTSIPLFALQSQTNDLFMNIVYTALKSLLGSAKPRDIIMRIILPRLNIVFLFTLLTVLSACEATITTHGRFIEADELDRLELGITTQAETIAILGQPSFEGAFNSGRLYYNNQKMEQKVAGTTSTIERELIVLIFDKNNILQSLELRDKNSDEKIVKLDSRTPTPGDRLTIVDQIFSNLRRGNVAE